MTKGAVNTHLLLWDRRCTSIKPPSSSNFSVSSKYMSTKARSPKSTAWSGPGSTVCNGCRTAEEPTTHRGAMWEAALLIHTIQALGDLPAPLHDRFAKKMSEEAIPVVFDPCASYPCFEWNGWKIAEPMTVLTDALLSLLSLFLGLYLLQLPRITSSQQFCAMGYIFQTIGYGAGAVVHGLGKVEGVAWIWDISMISTALYGTCLVHGTSKALWSSGRSAVVFALVWTACAVYIALEQMGYNKFQHMGIFLFFVETILLLIGVTTWIGDGSKAGMMMTFGAATVFGGTAIQRAKWGFHEHFNHNDVFHLLIGVAVTFMAVGVKYFPQRDRTIAPEDKKKDQ